MHKLQQASISNEYVLFMYMPHNTLLRNIIGKKRDVVRINNLYVLTILIQYLQLRILCLRLEEWVFINNIIC